MRTLTLYHFRMQLLAKGNEILPCFELHSEMVKCQCPHFARNLSNHGSCKDDNFVISDRVASLLEGRGIQSSARSSCSNMPIAQCLPSRFSPINGYSERVYYSEFYSYDLYPAATPIPQCLFLCDQPLGTPNASIQLVFSLDGNILQEYNKQLRMPNKILRRACISYLPMGALHSQKIRGFWCRQRP